jgi:hypothetical protein
MSEWDVVTASASHEITETVTNPLVDEAPGWLMDEAAPQGEIADLCTETYATFDGHVVDALYSNAAAAADKKPCLPAPDLPHFGVFATAGYSVSLEFGTSQTFAFKAFSTAPIELRLEPYVTDPAIVISPKQIMVKSGETVNLTITGAGIPASNTVLLYAYPSKNYLNPSITPMHVLVR